MTYAYGTRGAPAVGGGLPGLPWRAAAPSGSGVGSIILSDTDPGPGYVGAWLGQYLSQAAYPELFSKFGLLPDRLSDFSLLGSIHVYAIESGLGGVAVFVSNNSSYVSTDGGETLTAIQLATGKATLAVATDKRGNWLIAAYGGISGSPMSFLRSSDNAKTWTLVTQSTAIGQPTGAMKYVGNGAWLVSSGNGTTYKSTDFGETWTSVFSTVSGYYMASDGMGTVAIGAYGSPSLVYVSTNCGDTWAAKSLKYSATLKGLLTHMGKWVACRDMGSGTTAALWTSSDAFASYNTYLDGYPDGAFSLWWGSYADDGALILCGANGAGTAEAHTKLPSSPAFSSATFAAGSPARAAYFGQCCASSNAMYLATASGNQLWRAKRLAAYDVANTFYLPPLCSGTGPFKAYVRAR